MASTNTERVDVVVLEMVRLVASPPRAVHVAAPVPVAFLYRPADCGRDVSRPGRGVRIPEARARVARRCEPPRLEPLELLGHGRFDHGAEISARDLRAHERLKPLEFLAQSGTGRELHLVPTGSEGCTMGAAAGGTSGPRAANSTAGTGAANSLGAVDPAASSAMIESKPGLCRASGSGVTELPIPEEVDGGVR